MAVQGPRGSPQPGRTAGHPYRQRVPCYTVGWSDGNLSAHAGSLHAGPGTGWRSAPGPPHVTLGLTVLVCSTGSLPLPNGVGTQIFVTWLVGQQTQVGCAEWVAGRRTGCRGVGHGVCAACTCAFSPRWLRACPIAPDLPPLVCACTAPWRHRQAPKQQVPEPTCPGRPDFLTYLTVPPLQGTPEVRRWGHFDLNVEVARPRRPSTQERRQAR
jgi:hypothetical protein